MSYNTDPAAPAQAMVLSLDNAERYDEIIAESRKEALPEYGDLEIVTKPNATTAGNSGVVISFTVDDGGRRRRVQVTTTVRSLAVCLGPLTQIMHEEEALAATRGRLN